MPPYASALVLGGALLYTAPAWAEENCEALEAGDKQVTCLARRMSDIAKCTQLDNANSVNRCKAMVSINSYDCQKIDSLSMRLSCMSAVVALQRQLVWTAKPAR